MRALLLLLLPWIGFACGSRTLAFGERDGGAADVEAPEGCDAVVCGSACVSLDADPENCGRCGHSCGGGECRGGVCQPATLASGQALPFRIAVDASRIYWTNGGTRPAYDDGAVMSLALSGGTPMPLASSQLSPLGIAIDSTFVYWTDCGTTVMRTPLSGGTPVGLAQDQVGPGAIATDEGELFWINLMGGTVMELSAGAQDPVVLAAGLNEPTSIAVDSTRVYWTCRVPGGAIMAVPRGGGTPETLAADSADASPWGIAIDDAAAYWLSVGATSVALRKTLFSTGDTLTLADVPAPSPTGLGFGYSSYGIKLDGNSVLWVLPTAGVVLQVGKDGGTPTTLASNQAYPVGVAVDAQFVYWSNPEGGTIMRIAKP